MQKQQCTSVLVLSATHDTSSEVSRGKDKADEHAAADGWKMAYTNSTEAVPKQTRPLDVNQCQQKKKAWSCHIQP